MNLTSTQIKDTYGNLVTIGTVAGTPTTGTLQNGAGSDLTSITLNGGAVFNEGGGDFDFRVEGVGDANLLFVDASTARVGIGTASLTGKLHVSSGSSPNVANILIGFNNTSANYIDANTTYFRNGSNVQVARIASNGQLVVTPTAGGHTIFNEGGVDADFRVESDNDTHCLFVDGENDRVGIGTSTPAVKLDVSGQVRASTGILFGTDTAAANALDDYEEGTWTPILNFSGGTTGITYAFQDGRYTKIGRQVFVQCFISLTSKGSDNGSARLGGLPFTPPNINPCWTAGSIRATNVTFANQLGLINTINADYLQIQEMTEAGAVSAITNADFANNSVVIVGLTYTI